MLTEKRFYILQFLILYYYLFNSMMYVIINKLEKFKYIQKYIIQHI